MASNADKQSKGDLELDGGCQPEPIASPCAVVSQNQCQQSSRHGEESRLPQVVAKCRCDSFPGVSQRVRDHFDLSFLSSFRRIFSASFTSSSVSLPESIRCAITGCVLPPNSASRSSISFRCAAMRETAASKM